MEIDIVEVVDNNSIDREVTRFKPDVVIIEALWVVPEKFDVLKRLHPKIKWCVRLHSHMPFLALEGIATHWIGDYLKRKVLIIANSKQMYEALKPICGDNIIFIPNIYEGEMRLPDLREKMHVHIACLGAIRPLKNQLIQALAAIKWAQENKKYLYFHINSSRVEVGGEPVLKNLRYLFKNRSGTQLVEERWMEHEDLIEYLKKFDLGMQVSLSETFSIVSADYLQAGIPLIASKEVEWASSFSKAKDNDINSMVKIMNRSYLNPLLVMWNQYLLKRDMKKATKMWVNFCLDWDRKQHHHKA
jgi:hypothetical protein